MKRRIITASSKYRVGDSVTFDGNYLGATPRLKSGTIVSVGRGLASHGDPNPGNVYTVELEDGRKCKVDEAAIEESVECNTDIYAAEDNSNDKLADAIDSLKEDFDYIIAGLERLDRQGANGSNDALMIAENISTNLQGHLSEIASHIGE